MGIETAILGSAIIGGGLSYLSSKEQSSAAQSAANTQASAADRASQLQYQMFQENRSDLAPWREAGGRSLAELERLQGTYESAVMNPNQYQQSPGYGWLQQQGLDALQKSGAASGTPITRDAIQFGQGLALQDYTGYLGRLESLMNRYAGTAQVGQTASNTLAQLGQNYAGNVGNLYQNAGNAIASGQINQANARTGLYQNLANIGANAANQYSLNNYLGNLGNQSQQPSYYSFAAPSQYAGNVPTSGWSPWTNVVNTTPTTPLPDDYASIALSYGAGIT